MTVYVLVFSQPLGNPSVRYGTAQTYTGWCRSENPYRRVVKHLRGGGSAIVRAAIERGLDVRIAAIIPGATQADERRIKNWHAMPVLLERWRRVGYYRQQSGNLLVVQFPGYGELGWSL